MVDELVLSGERVWFSDTRSPTRRMGVSSHPDDGVIVLSLWQAETCTASFRLPIDDAERLVRVLTDAIAGDLSAHVSEAAV